jgi:hypothetical protein
MNRPDQLSAYHATGGPTSASSTAAPSSTSTTSIQAEHKPPVGAIAGGAAGGAFVLAAIMGLVIYYVCFAKKSRKGYTDTMKLRQSIPADVTTRGDHIDPVKSSDGEPFHTRSHIKRSSLIP